MSKQLTATEVLNELKLTKKKIEDSIPRIMVGYLTTEEKKIVPPGFKTQEEFKNKAKSQLDSVQGLINYHQKLKKALVLSNATTKVNVGSQEMTVAEAIERKASIVNDKKICNGLKDAWKKLSDEMEKLNGPALEVKADNFVAAIPKEVLSTEGERANQRSSFIARNTAKFVGLDSPRELIEKMESSIHEFESKIDVSLSVINARTLVTIED